MATQGKEVNPMAPSYEPAEEEDDSRVPLWAESSILSTQARPSYILAQPGEQFGFRVPGQATITPAR